MFKFILIKLISTRKKNFKLDGRITNKAAFNLLLELAINFFRSVIVFRIHPLRKCVFGKSVKLKHREFLTLGSSIRFGDFVVIDSLGRSGIYLGDSVSIGDYSKLVVTSDYSNLGDGIVLEDGVGIGEFSRLGGSGGVKIGRDTVIGQYFSCHPENHIFTDINKPIKQQGTKRSSILIGQDCWIGAKVTILAGTKIGRHSVIAAGAVVNGEFPPYSVIGGIPARIIKDIK